MATSNLDSWSTVPAAPRQGEAVRLTNAAWRALEWMGSLKLTVALFAVSMVLVLVGTIAQQELNMVEVKERYFTSWIAQMRVADFVPYAFIPHGEIPGWFPFPGGALVGALLLLNLIAAKATRFHVRVRGTRLFAGLAIFAFGLLLCYLVVNWGNATDGVQGGPKVGYSELWSGLVAGMAVLWLTTAYLAYTSERKGWRLIWFGVAIVFGAMGIASLSGLFAMSAPSLRITWQLLEGTVVALVLLVGSRILFGQQGGNLLLHFGIALMMVGQFAFGDVQLEQRLSLIEGQSTNTLINMDQVELTFVQQLESDQEQVTAIPEAKLLRSLRSGQPIKDERLPFDIKVVQFFSNSDLTRVPEKNPATVGLGLSLGAKERPPAGGTTSEMDLAAAYVELLDKKSGESKGVYLVSQQVNDGKFLTLGTREDEMDLVRAEGTDYQVGLRFTRVPKPYWVQVKDVQRINYSGTSTPRDFSSYITLVDTETGQTRNERVWMNNPLRYRGETFYQSDYQVLEGGKEFTSIQVVKNAGWMIPYVSCMIVAIGMLAHFAGTLDRFIGRRERELTRAGNAAEQPYASPTEPTKNPSPGSKHGWLVPTFAGITGLLCFVSLIPWSAVSMGMRPAERETKFDFYTAGEIPARFGGRVLPLDAVAQQMLYAVSNRTSLKLKPKDDELPPAPQAIIDRAGNGRSLSALQWLFEVAGSDEAISDLHMIRIDADEILNHFNLDRRKSKLYSLAELRGGSNRFDEEVQIAAEKDETERSFKEVKLLELASRLNAFQSVQLAFAEPTPPPLPESMRSEEFTAEQQRQAQLMILARQMAALRDANIPTIIPPSEDAVANSTDYPPWQPFSSAEFMNWFSSVSGEPESKGTKTFAAMVKAYDGKNAAEFNKAADEHLAVMAEVAPPDYQAGKVAAERWLEAVQPTVAARILYGVFMVLGIFSLMVDVPKLRWGIWSGLVCVAVLHSIVLLTRIYITGKAPVINLYSSAVFIGWAVVVAALVYEVIFPRGIGNLVASVSGLLTLMVAFALGTGDTMPVLQAVLDTQFWLATHVITVTLGYSATFLAGLLGIAYLFMGVTGRQKSVEARDVYRMLYSATCFGILFSFIGTVLGGLWADDSWGRFWGWDPKENGALLIVIWNALMLHARWDGMVRERGMALLAIGGNIITAWSWFGTNQLGLGLHAYGGNSGAKIWLGIFVLSQLTLIGFGLIMLKKSKSAEAA